MLDSVTYLTSYGWEGKGKGLRDGAMSRPLAIPQKRTLAGLGKDRDEAFPFWDHLFAAASKSIKIKVDSDDEEGSLNDSPAEVTLLRTTTGILSNRRPTSGTPITSGSATPSEPECSSTSRLSLLTMAKRESARRNLYSRFFRGPVLGPDVNPEMVNPSSKSADTPNAAGPSISIPEDLTKEKNEKKWRRKNEDDSLTKKEKKRKKPKLAKSPDKEEPKGTEAADTPEPTKTREETREERQARKAARAEKRKEREAKQKAKDELCKAKKERRKSREERKKLREERRREKLDKKNAKKGLI